MPNEQEQKHRAADALHHGGVDLGRGVGLIQVAITEMIGAREGIGYILWNAWQSLAVGAMYVGLMVIAILGFLSTLILETVAHLVLPGAIAMHEAGNRHA